MKILRSVNRRSFSVDLAGGYTFLRPSERFIPAHPPGDFRYLANLYKGTAFPQVHENPATAPQFELIPSPYQNDPLYRRLLRPALIVLAVLALIYFYW